MKNLPRRSICLLDRLIVFVLLLYIGHSASAAEKIIGVDKSKLGLRPTVCTQLPFDLTKVPSINKVKLSQEAKALLSKNGFVVVGPPHGSMPRCYEGGLMPLVTIDSVLEVFLSDFEIAWGAIEDKQAKRFARLQVDLWNALVARFEQLPEGAARVAGQRLLGLVAVGRSLSDPEWTILNKVTVHGFCPYFYGCAQRYLCQGGVFDYCEFDRPLGSALSRKKFRQLMDSRQAPLPPKWTKSYRVNIVTIRDKRKGTGSNAALGLKDPYSVSSALQTAGCQGQSDSPDKSLFT